VADADTSAFTVIARRPADLIAEATCSACSAWSTSFTATSAPSAAKISAMPRPMPLAAPVTSATLPFSRKNASCKTA
jgi:hypothetical protein